MTYPQQAKPDISSRFAVAAYDMQSWRDLYIGHPVWSEKNLGEQKLDSQATTSDQKLDCPVEIA